MRERFVSAMPCQYSVVVPMHNEEGNVDPLAARLLAAMDALEESYELIFVDDGSTDSTFTRLSRLAQLHSEVRVVKLKRNFGQTPALAAGFDYAAGEIILAMDGDLRSDPAEISVLLNKLEEGYDVVNGWRRNRAHEGFTRIFPSRVANRWLARLSGVPINDFGTTFKAYRREVVEGFRLYGEQHRYLPVLAAWQGARIAEVPVSDSPRSYGKSHYGIGRVFHVPFDLLTIKFLRHFRMAPLRLFGVPGLLSLLAGLLVYAGLAGAWLFDQHAILARAADGVILGAILLISGIQLMAMGLLGELLALSYFGPQREPIYRVERILSGSEETIIEPAPRAKSAGVS
jgi:glycosyltransferase involved in cell wall biosynthesis